MSFANVPGLKVGGWGMGGLYGVNEARLWCLIVWNQTGDHLTFIYQTCDPQRVKWWHNKAIVYLHQNSVNLHKYYK